MRKIRKLLVANRGEIAVRIIRSAKTLGIATVAVYADDDFDSLAAQMADEAYALPGGTATATYLNREAILEIALRAKVDAVHPGYGFLSEDADFATAVTAAKIIWLGPSPTAIAALGDKISARSIAKSQEVPVIPGETLSGQKKTAKEQTLRVGSEGGYPILVKRADSGGGRGITRLDSPAEVRRYFADLPRGATIENSFVEKMVQRARHVETQCVRDQHGNFAVVSTRDCSVQRRNQKVIEEAPAPHLPPHLCEKLCAWSETLFSAVDYVGVGTCEFLVETDHADSNQCDQTDAGGTPDTRENANPNDSGTASGRPRAYFLEVNPRLQVEHTVSEEITGIDLVSTQIRIAEGTAIDPVPPARGHAIEVRITSENPADNLMPATGQITTLTLPGGPGVRLDTFLRTGEKIGANFDSLIAKLIVSGPNRATAISRLLGALDEIIVEGLPTCVPLLKQMLTDADFYGPDRPEYEVGRALLLRDDIGVYTTWLEDTDQLGKITKERQSAQLEQPNSASETANLTEFVVEVGGKRVVLRIPASLWEQLGGEKNPKNQGFIAQTTNSIFNQNGKLQTLLGRFKHTNPSAGGSDEPNIVAPIQGTIVRIPVCAGETVKEGDLVAVMESMKMEKPLYATIAGKISKINLNTGDSVSIGQTIVEILPAS
ncbi:MAG: biotin carboxylase N-terminal domain-containing protein [Actinomycetaceae bacterium]|nr:biotin carboxylase N-terminal domain-containing protein [Actinomycetaceae bacterium]